MSLITHQHLDKAWDYLQQSSPDSVPADAFDQLYRAVSEICKRLDKIEAMLEEKQQVEESLKLLEAELEACVKEFQRKFYEDNRK